MLMVIITTSKVLQTMITVQITIITIRKKTMKINPILISYIDPILMSLDPIVVEIRSQGPVLLTNPD